MSIINSDSIVANKVMLSQQINKDVEQWLQSGGQLQQLNNGHTSSAKLSFNNGHLAGMCELQVSAQQYSTVTERRELVFKYIAKHPKCSTNTVANHLKIWHGHVANDIKYLRKHGRVQHERIGVVYYYTVGIAGGVTHD